MVAIIQDERGKYSIDVHVFDREGKVIKTKKIDEKYIKTIMRTTDEDLKLLKFRILYILENKGKATYHNLKKIIQETTLGHINKYSWIEFSNYQIRHQIDVLKKQGLVETKNGAASTLLTDARRCFYGLSTVGKAVIKYLKWERKIQVKTVQCTLLGKQIDIEQRKTEKQTKRKRNTKRAEEYIPLMKFVTGSPLVAE